VNSTKISIIGFDNAHLRAQAESSLTKGESLARDDLVEMEGKVVEILVGGNFRIDVQGGHSVLAHLSGRMRRNRIRVVLGDHVTVGVSPYDPGRGLITYRAK
jgi:translation initiation factor IF-1